LAGFALIGGSFAHATKPSFDVEPRRLTARIGKQSWSYACTRLCEAQALDPPQSNAAETRFFFTLSPTEPDERFFRVVIFDVRERRFRDYAEEGAKGHLNAQHELVALDLFPFFGEDPADPELRAFKKSKKIVKLDVVDLETLRRKTLASKAAFSFEPAFDAQGRLQYRDPRGKTGALVTRSAEALRQSLFAPAKSP